MFHFTIRSADPNLVAPFEIEQSGSLTTDEAVDKTGVCTVNGVTLHPGDRIVVEGKISRKFPIRIHHQWGIEFRGKEPQFFNQVMQSWFDAAGIPEAEHSTWRLTLDWDGCDLTAFPETEYQRPDLQLIQAA